MGGTPGGRPLDPLLLPYLRAPNEAEARRQLERLLQEHADPLVRAIVRRKLDVAPGRGSGAQRQQELDAEDVHAEALLNLAARLERLRQEQASDARIASFHSYVAVTAEAACDLHLRRKHRRRDNLKGRLIYLLDGRANQTGFARWTDADGETLAGFAAWQTAGRRFTRSERFQQLRANPRPTTERLLPNEDFPRMNSAALLAALLNWVGHPLPLDDLVRVFAEVLEIREPLLVRESDRDPEAEVSPLERADERQAVEPQVLWRDYLQRLWEAILQLPEHYRVPLLLNLRDDRDGAVIAHLPDLGIASIAQIAACVGIPPREFAALWWELPLDDNTIAARLGLKRQDVINRRMLARRSLARAMQPFN